MTIPNQSPTNDSTAAGILQPVPPEPDYQITAGDSLEDYLQQWVAGVAYLDGTLVRPRWQGPDPPNLPDYGTDWAATGIIRRQPIGAYSAAIYYGDDGIEQRQRHEEFVLLCTFYGPHADEYASNLHDGAQVWQNYRPLWNQGLKLIEVQEARRVPELIKNQWTDRVDKQVIFRRIIRRNYSIKSLLSATGWVYPDPPGTYQAPFTVPGWVTFDVPSLGFDQANLFYAAALRQRQEMLEGVRRRGARRAPPP